MKVLIIDDDNFIRTVYESLLKQENIEPVLAENGESGLALAREHSPDLILLDMIMPGKSGFEVIEELKADEALKSIPVIIFSSLSQQSDIDEAMKLGAAGYYPKDQNASESVVEKVKELLMKGVE
jgi:DNA-binding NarL/FixJ family response regulator